MLRRFLLALLCAVTLTACCNKGEQPKFAAAPVKKSLVYTPPCTGGNYARPADDPVYVPSNCSPFETFVEQFSQVPCPFRGLGLPGLDCKVPAPQFVPTSAAPPPCAPAVTAAPLPACGPLPADAKPGDVWCCTLVQPPAAPPVRVQVAPGTTEWRPIQCPPVPGAESQECYVLVETPPQYAMRASAPPPGHWEWRLTPECKAPAAPKAAPCVPGVK